MRLRRDDAGFTLVELLVVLIIIAILLTLGVSSFRGLKTRAQSSTAKANIRMAIPAANAYYADNKTYVGMTNALLRSTYDKGIPTTVTLSSLTATSYTLTYVRGSCTARVTGPGPTITVTGTGCT
ncbi:MAG: prepilin-type N-terminal cleavage/methylation domain-containing protein [Thermoleophilia bacterium]|nr:prepilin-type N-terminal cleavage/methylation domain-containing protein [Thermoleophilia bacterium]